MPSPKSTPSRVAKFNKATVARLIDVGIPGRNIREDASPLVLRTTAGGASWSVMRKVNGRMRTFSMTGPDGAAVKNSANTVPPEAARRWALGIVGELAQGNDPMPGRRPAGTDFVTVAEQHLAEYRGKARPSSVVAREYGIRYALPTLGRLSVDEIGTEHVLALHAACDTPSKATKAHIAVTEVLAFAMRRGLVPTNIAKAVPAPERPAARDRYPSLPELARIEGAAIEDGSVGAQLIRFCLRTGVRATAAASLRWSEIDLDNAEMKLAPEPGRKFTTTVRLPLTDSAAAMLRETERTEGTDLVFPGRDRHGNPAQFRSWDALYRRLRKASGVDGWSAHDFRRSMVSITAEHAPEVNVVALDRALGHTGGATLGNVAGVYQRSSMMPQMRAALAAWDRLLVAAFGGNVVEFARRAG